MPDPNMRLLLIGFAQRGDGTEAVLSSHRLVRGVLAAGCRLALALR